MLVKSAAYASTFPAHPACVKIAAACRAHRRPAPTQKKQLKGLSIMKTIHLEAGKLLGFHAVRPSAGPPSSSQRLKVTAANFAAKSGVKTGYKVGVKAGIKVGIKRTA